MGKLINIIFQIKTTIINNLENHRKIYMVLIKVINNNINKKKCYKTKCNHLTISEINQINNIITKNSKMIIISLKSYNIVSIDKNLEETM